MSMEFANRICPNCKNANYMVFLGDFSTKYKYKCMNCNRYFNDIDFEKEPLQPVWKSKCMNTKADMVEVVRCKDCKHYRINTVYPGTNMIMKYCAKTGIPESNPDWFCACGERKEGR